MKNYISKGDCVTVIATETTVSGAGVLLGSMFGVYGSSVPAGEPVAVHRIGEFELPKLAAQAWTVGQKVYWDDTNSRCTTVASGNVLVGFAAAAAANPSDTGVVLLTGQAT